MGNCLIVNKIVAQDEHEPPKEAVAMEQTRLLSPSKLERASQRIDGRKKKTVRFKLREENSVDRERGGGGESEGGGVVRIRVVVTQRELRQLLNYKQDYCNYSSVGQLLSAMKSRSRRISEVGTSTDGGFNGSWRPALESIPEDH